MLPSLAGAIVGPLDALTSILILMLAFSCLSRVGFSQAAEGDIQGIVVNAQGQLRAQATIRAVNVETVLTRTAITAADGTFSLVALPPGVYKVSALGDSTVQDEERMVHVLIGQTAAVDFRKPLRIAEQVTVAADTSQIQIGQSQVDHVVSGIEIETLPINGRTFQQLAVLTPGVGAAIQIDPTKNHVGAISISAGAGRRVNARIDGGDNNDDVVGSLLQQYSQEAIQEFAVVTDAYKGLFVNLSTPFEPRLNSQVSDAERFAYSHSNRNAMPMPMTTNCQTQRVLIWITRRPESRNTKPPIRNSGPVIAQ